MLRFLAAPCLAVCTALMLPAQKLAITFDDLPAHGDMPTTSTRQQIADSILATLKQQHMPKTYGFVNALSVQDEPETLGVLQAWHNTVTLSAITPGRTPTSTTSPLKSSLRMSTRTKPSSSTSIATAITSGSAIRSCTKATPWRSIAPSAPA